MKMLSEDDLDLEGMSNEELAAAWDLWFDLAQATNSPIHHTPTADCGPQLGHVAPASKPASSLATGSDLDFGCARRAMATASPRL